MKNHLIAMKEKGEKILGTMMCVGNESTMECVGLAPLDFVCIDLEHGLYDYPDMLALIRAANYRGLTPLVRAKDSVRSSILKAADAGAKGIVVPMIKSVDEVEKFVEYGKYDPVGQRGMCPNRCADFGEAATIRRRPVTEYFAEANEEVLLLPQCETREFMENIDDILSLPGVDGTLVGPNDLSISLGHPGDVFGPAVDDALKAVVAACKKYNKFSIMTGLSYEHSRACYEMGFDAVLFGLESRLVVEMYTDIVRRIKGEAKS